jgi:hypothetical protein
MTSPKILRDVSVSGGAIAGSGNAMPIGARVSETTTMSKAAFLRAREILRARIDDEQDESARLPVFDENYQKIADSSEFTPVDNYTLDWALTAALEPTSGLPTGRRICRRAGKS